MNERDKPRYHMTPDEFRRHGRAVIDWIATYMERVETLPVLSEVAPGEVMAAMPTAPPEQGEPFDATRHRPGARDR